MQPTPIDQEIRLEQEIPAVRQLLKAVKKLFNRHPMPPAYHQQGAVFGLDTDHPHLPNRLDANKLLALFDQLHLDSGYALDYVYYNEGIGGAPVLYTRPAQAAYPSTDLRQTYSNDEIESIWQVEHLHFNPTPLGYLQLAVFRLVSGQFYLFWHALYNDHQLVLDQAEALKICTGLGPGEFEIDYPAAVRQLDFTPRLTVHSDGSAELIAFTFSEWGGFTRRSWAIQPPAQIRETAAQTPVPYWCGIQY